MNAAATSEPAESVIAINPEVVSVDIGVEGTKIPTGTQAVGVSYTERHSSEQTIQAGAGGAD